MKPYYQDDAVEIYHGDSRELAFVMNRDLVITDPVYGTGVALNTEGFKMVGDADTRVRDEVLRSLKGVPMIVFGSPKVVRPDVTLGCQACLIWDKGELTGMGNLDFPWKLSHEEIYIIGQGFRADHRSGSVLRFHARPAWTKHPNALEGLHVTEKPLALMLHLVERAPTGRIIDPFMGSGTTLRAAKDLGREAIGIDVDERCCEIAAKRMAQEVMQFHEATPAGHRSYQTDMP